MNRRLLLATALLPLAMSPVRADYPATITADGPAVYYRFEEAEGAAVLTDSSGNGLDSLDFTGTAGTTVTGGAGRIGNGILFNGDGSIVTPLTLDPSAGDFSIEAMINTGIIPTAGSVLLSNQDGGGLGRSNLVVDSFGLINSFLGGLTTGSGTYAVPGEWVHVIMTYDKSAADDGLGEPTIRFYLNGVAGATGTPVGEFADGNWVVGSHKSQASQFYNGQADEISVWNYRLDDPNGDGDEADSKVASHYRAYVNDTDILLTLTSDPVFVSAGQSTTLSWTTSTALTALTLNDGSGPVNVLPDTTGGAGTRVVSPSATTTYTLTGTSPLGTESLEITVNVNAPPVIASFTSDLSSVLAGTKANLTWNVANADTVTINNGVGPVDPSGTTAVAVATTTTWTLTATNAFGTRTADVTVIANTTDPALVAHWRVGEVPGEKDGFTLVSETGITFDGTFVGNAAFDTTDPAPVAGGSTASLAFDGVGYVDILGWNGVGGGTSRTVAFWFKGSAFQTNDNATLVSWGPNTTSNRFDVRLSANTRNGTMRTEVSGSGRDGVQFLADDTWHHAAVVIADDGSPNIGEALFYVDGVLDTAAVGGATAINTLTTVNVRLGASRTLARALTGKMDDIRIYSRALTDNEIATLAERAEPSGTFAVTGITRLPSGEVDITWTGAPGSYALDYSLTLTGTWTEISDVGFIPAGQTTGTATDNVIAPVTSSPRVFYRIRKLP